MSKFAEDVLGRLNRPRLCKLGSILASMEQEDWEALDYAIAMVRQDKESQAWLVKVLNDNGYTIGKTAVGDHLREVCSCDRS